MFALFVFLLLATSIIFWNRYNYYGVNVDATLIGAYTNLLVFNATIFTPIAAYFFYDNWKEQKKLIKLANIASDALDICNELRHSILQIRIAHHNSPLGLFRATMLLRPFKENLREPDRYIGQLFQKVRMIENISGNQGLNILVKDILNNKLNLENYMNNIFRKKWSYEENQKYVKNKTIEISQNIATLEDELYCYIRYEDKTPKKIKLNEGQG